MPALRYKPNWYTWSRERDSRIPCFYNDLAFLA